MTILKLIRAGVVLRGDAPHARQINGYKIAEKPCRGPLGTQHPTDSLEVQTLAEWRAYAYRHAYTIMVITRQVTE